MSVFTNATDNPDGITGPGWGSGVLVEVHGTAIAASTTVNLGPFYVGNMPSLVTTVAAGSNNQLFYTFTWRSTPVTTGNFLGQTGYLLAGNTNGVADAIANKGPYLVISIQNQSVSPGTYYVTVCPSYGAVGSLGQFPDRTLISVQNLTVAATTAVSINPSQCVPGPAVMWCNGPVAGVISVRQFGGGSGFVIVAQVDVGPGASGQDNPVGIVLPNNELEFVIHNTSTGAAGFYATLISGR